MADDARSCPSCGARVPEGAAKCKLCGTPVEGASDASTPSDEDAGDAETQSAESGGSSSGSTSPAEHVYCNQCGFENPLNANYCSRCGSELQDLTDTASSSKEAVPDGIRTVSADLPDGPAARATEAPAEGTAEEKSEEDEQVAMGRQILVMVGVGLIFVLGFFFATQWSQQYEWGGAEENGEASTEAATGPNANGAAPSAGSRSGPSASSTSPQTDLATLVDELSEPLDGPMATKIDSLRTAAEEAEGKERRQVQSQLVKLYVGAGAPGRAALLQSEFADETGAVDARRRAANLLYRWMRQVEQQGDRARIADVARHVASAYEEVAQQRSQDLDARTRMGEAYLLTNNPMKGIEAINAVLKEDSTFVPARFQKGLALLQINRLDQAVRQFETVMEYADQQEPFYQQAEQAIKVIEKRSSSSDAQETPPNSR